MEQTFATADVFYDKHEYDSWEVVKSDKLNITCICTTTISPVTIEDILLKFKFKE